MANYIKNEEKLSYQKLEASHPSLLKKAVKLKEAVAKKHHPKIFTFYTPSLDHT